MDSGRYKPVHSFLLEIVGTSREGFLVLFGRPYRLFLLLSDDGRWRI